MLWFRDCALGRFYFALSKFQSMQATVCARFGLQCIIYMGAKVWDFSIVEEVVQITESLLEEKRSCKFDICFFQSASLQNLKTGSKGKMNTPLIYTLRKANEVLGMSSLDVFNPASSIHRSKIESQKPFQDCNDSFIDTSFPCRTWSGSRSMCSA